LRNGRFFKAQLAPIVDSTQARSTTMSIYSDLLFHHGHIANAELARSLAAAQAGPAGPGPAAPAPAAGAAQATPGEPAPAASRGHSALLRAMTALSPFR